MVFPPKPKHHPFWSETTDGSRSKRVEDKTPNPPGAPRPQQFQLATDHTFTGSYGLRNDDGIWRRTIDDSKHMQTGPKLRSLFVIIVRDCMPTRPMEHKNRSKVLIFEMSCDLTSTPLQLGEKVDSAKLIESMFEVDGLR